MADTKTHTGCRDDLTVDASRCLKMRYSESGCRRCVDICPHKAVSLDGFLAINPNHCSGCLLCTSVCPAGALEQNSDFSNSLAQLSRVPEPVLGCLRTKEHSNATLACLGGLSAEHLVTLCHTLPGTLTLNLTACNGCPNSTMILHLRQCIEALFTAGLLEGGCSIVAAESAQIINYRDESIGRRSFFHSFRNALFQSAAVILSANNEPTERRTEYAGKRLPVRRELLNNSRNKLPQELVVRIQKHFDVRATISEVCTMCQGCVAICPTGALNTGESDVPPAFDHVRCTGCQLCAEFCLDAALHIHSVTQ
ncbi:MAG: 4Fe-4S binding protein [Desulfuromonadaceae bacterium]|nr:4Fe-4S binding protein [Desulfuromonadaceae bacterium]